VQTHGQTNKPQSNFASKSLGIVWALFPSLSNRSHNQQYTALPAVRSGFLSNIFTTFSLVFAVRVSQYKTVRGRKASYSYTVSNVAWSTRATTIEQQRLHRLSAALIGCVTHYSSFLQAHGISNNKMKYCMEPH
jgi:hypothetical protein